MPSSNNFIRCSANPQSNPRNLNLLFLHAQQFLIPRKRCRALRSSYLRIFNSWLSKHYIYTHARAKISALAETYPEASKKYHWHLAPALQNIRASARRFRLLRLAVYIIWEWHKAHTYILYYNEEDEFIIIQRTVQLNACSSVHAIIQLRKK